MERMMEVTKLEKEEITISDLKSMRHFTHSANLTTAKPLKLLEEEIWLSENSREISQASNSTWMLPLRPSSLLPTRTNHGTFKTQEALPICRSGKPTEDGSRCLSTLEETNSRMREACLSESKTKRTLL
jgi:hypothetical protein